MKKCFKKSLDPPLRSAIKVRNEVNDMLYTVKEMSEIASVTIKTLHHYDKIGLLPPDEVSEAGYRLYGRKALERLQEILFYRELDFPLKEIKAILDGQPDRVSILSDQKKQLEARSQRLERLVDTLDESIRQARKGELMDKKALFKGFENEEEWKAALADQNEHLKETYGYDLLKEKEIDVPKMNESALEAKHFMDEMAKSLVDGVKRNDEKVQQLIAKHIDFLNKHGHKTTAADLAKTTRFFLNDDFHRKMLEDQQTGLAYYLCLAAEGLVSVEE